MELPLVGTIYLPKRDFLCESGLFEPQTGTGHQNMPQDSLKSVVYRSFVTCDDPKGVIEDLLKGAFDLQESLVMLGKLQEASEYMTKLRKNLIQQALAGEIRTCCRSQKRRVFDRRKVDLYQDFPLLATSSSERSSREKACFAGRELVMSPVFPSTSSSQFASFDCSPARIQKEKPKVPNLIARLMGLEDVPSTPLHQKQLEKDKVFKQRRPIFEIDLPKAKKLPGVNQKSSADDAPPIVIMKPVYAPELQAERFSTSIHDENPPYTNDSSGKWNSKEENSPVNFTIYRKMQARKVQKSSCIPKKDQGQ
ncbi:hypothetical protein HAX54_004434 [Datura stramonium]|uniref:DUF3741 domain-containing protein n=1 Tax=Datura stramonium TaxID=4076 RepID=A0ABS8T6W7_DATST|nr:hypothetical protein [Datura stramonium]